MSNSLLGDDTERSLSWDDPEEQRGEFAKNSSKSHTLGAKVELSGENLESSQDSDCGIPPFVYNSRANVVQLNPCITGAAVQLTANVDITGNLSATTITTPTLTATTATMTSLTVDNLTVTNTNPTSIHITGPTTYTLSPDSSIQYIYVNSIDGPVSIVLGESAHMGFASNRTLTVKDISLLFGAGSDSNISIRPATAGAPQAQTYIEYFNGTEFVTGLGPYTIPTVGGAVTFIFIHTTLLGGRNSWQIISEHRGNPKLLSRQRVIPPASTEDREGLLSKRS